MGQTWDIVDNSSNNARTYILNGRSDDTNKTISIFDGFSECIDFDIGNDVYSWKRLNVYPFGGTAIYPTAVYGPKTVRDTRYEIKCNDDKQNLHGRYYVYYSTFTYAEIYELLMSTDSSNAQKHWYDWAHYTQRDFVKPWSQDIIDWIMPKIVPWCLDNLSSYPIKGSIEYWFTLYGGIVQYPDKGIKYCNLDETGMSAIEKYQKNKFGCKSYCDFHPDDCKSSTIARCIGDGSLVSCDAYLNSNPKDEYSYQLYQQRLNLHKTYGNRNFTDKSLHQIQGMGRLDESDQKFYEQKTLYDAFKINSNNPNLDSKMRLEYDKIVKTYCDGTTKGSSTDRDVICSCYDVMSDPKYPVKNGGYFMAPECLSGVCKDQGYKPFIEPNRSHDCPNICIQNIDVSAGNIAILKNISFYQQCFNAPGNESQKDDLITKLKNIALLDMKGLLSVYVIACNITGNSTVSKDVDVNALGIDPTKYQSMYLGITDQINNYSYITETKANQEIISTITDLVKGKIADQLKIINIGLATVLSDTDPDKTYQDSKKVLTDLITQLDPLIQTLQDNYIKVKDTINALNSAMSDVLIAVNKRRDSILLMKDANGKGPTDVQMLPIDNAIAELKKQNTINNLTSAQDKVYKQMDILTNAINSVVKDVTVNPNPSNPSNPSINPDYTKILSLKKSIDTLMDSIKTRENASDFTTEYNAITALVNKNNTYDYATLIPRMISFQTQLTEFSMKTPTIQDINSVKTTESGGYDWTWIIIVIVAIFIFFIGSSVAVYALFKTKKSAPITSEIDKL